MRWEEGEITVLRQRFEDFRFLVFVSRYVERIVLGLFKGFKVCLKSYL